MYLTIKKITGIRYLYAESIQRIKGEHARDKHYEGSFGRIYKLNPNERTTTEAENELRVCNLYESESISDKIKKKYFFELYKCGFVHVGGGILSKSSDNIYVDLETLSVFRSQKSYPHLSRNSTKRIVLEINEGFLCDYTLERIIRYRHDNKKDENENRKILLRWYIEAGLPLEDDCLKDWT
ncbi:MAG: hypothetical protein WC781_05565 [Candidatus Pacearchaeota archaeon]|jgi:hypothetical protein